MLMFMAGKILLRNTSNHWTMSGIVMIIYLAGHEEVKRSGQEFLARLVYISRTCLHKCYLFLFLRVMYKRFYKGKKYVSIK